MSDIIAPSACCQECCSRSRQHVYEIAALLTKLEDRQRQIDNLEDTLNEFQDGFRLYVQEHTHSGRSSGASSRSNSRPSSRARTGRSSEDGQREGQRGRQGAPPSLAHFLIPTRMRSISPHTPYEPSTPPIREEGEGEDGMEGETHTHSSMNTGRGTCSNSSSSSREREQAYGEITGEGTAAERVRCLGQRVQSIRALITADTVMVDPFDGAARPR
jgi:hypothetical protein